MTSPVYFWNLRASLKAPYAERIRRLLARVGFAGHVEGGELTAIKIHFGERGVTSHVQPLMLKPVVDFLVKAGARPFLTDASTLYVGQRGEAVSHAMQAALHGFDPLLLGAPVVIADGLKGASQTALPVRGGKHFSEAFIAADIAAADLLVSVTHAKGHELAGFGGALKNIGMGAASKQGKMQQHVSTGRSWSSTTARAAGPASPCAPPAPSPWPMPGRRKEDSPRRSPLRGLRACFLACRHGGLEIDGRPMSPPFWSA